MTKIDNGGPAFPQCYRVPGHSTIVGESGMSIRDWFAGQERITTEDCPSTVALSEALAGESMPSHGWSAANTREENLAMLRWEAKWRAALRFMRADAMLAARKGGAA